MLEQATAIDLYAEALKDPEKMYNAVVGLKYAVNELQPSVRKILKYIAKDSIDPYKSVSVVCDFINVLDAYLERHAGDEDAKLARSVRWSTIVNSGKTSDEIFKDGMFERIGEKMTGVREPPGFTHMDEFINELTDAGVLYRYQAPRSEVRYTLTSEAVEALRVLNQIRKFPWAYPIDILPQGSVVTKDQKNSKAFPEYKKRFLELVGQIIEGVNLNIPENVQGL